MTDDAPDPKRSTSLMAPEARGGDIAEGGFRFQDHMILVRIPEWLAHDGFTSMAREMLGDTEAAFFVPSQGVSREFVEYKDHTVGPAELRGEIARFRQLHAGAPGVYRRFVLSCRGLTATLAPMAAALERVRGALPFYGDAGPIAEASYGDFQSAADKVGVDADAARFVYDHVVLEADAPDAERYGPLIFADALRHALPEHADAAPRDVEAARRALADLVGSRKAKPILRVELEAALLSNLSPGVVVPSRAVRLHTATTDEDTGPPGSIPIRWAPFFGDDRREYPERGQWDRLVVGELRATRQWMLDSGRPRRVHLTGARRLSASLAIGSVFSAVAGFNVDLEYRGDRYRTDAHATTDTPDYVWTERFEAGTAGNQDLVLGIGILNDVREDVMTWLGGTGRAGAATLFLHGADAVTSAEHANRAVAGAKIAILRAVERTRGARLHLFLAAPAHFALFLGHRLNAVGPIVCHERTAPGTYVPTCTIWDRP